MDLTRNRRFSGPL